MPFIVLDPLPMRKDKFCSLEANAIMEVMAYRKVEDKCSVAKGGTPRGRWGHFQAERAAWAKAQW